MKADFVCICFVTKHYYTALPRFSFSLIYSLLFSVHIVNVNTAKSCTVLDTYTYTYIYIYIYRKSAGRFSRGTVLNTLKQSRINIKYY